MLKPVLVVEDEYLISMLLQGMLEDLGCARITLANDITSSYEALDTSRPDLVVLDLNLAGQSASPVADKLRAEGVPFIISSGYSANTLPAELKGYPVLTKPFGSEEIQSRIEQALAMEKL